VTPLISGSPSNFIATFRKATGITLKAYFAALQSLLPGSDTTANAPASCCIAAS
jgi:hypothetical protein